MKKLIATATIATLALAVQSVSAMMIADANYRDTDLLRIEMNANNASVSGMFDLVNDDGDGLDLLGFNPSMHTVLDAMVGFVFAGSDNGVPYLLERITFQLGSALNNWNGDQSFGIEGYSISGVVTGDLIVDIQEDGLLDWKVNIDQQDLANYGPITLWGVYLGVIAEPNAPQNRVAVPDASSTAALLGLGLLGLAVIRRRR